MPLTSSAKATAIGLLAPFCWGMSVGLIRRITESFGLTAGMTLLSAVICVLLLFIQGRPDWKKYPRRYLLFGMPMANISSVCFCASLYLSSGAQQTVEVGMVNYLWPCLIVFFAVLFNGQKARWWMVPGVVISFLGVMMVLGGDGGINPPEIWAHMRENPYSYLLAFTGAVAWAAYSNFTKAWSKGQDPTILVFAVDTVAFAALWAAGLGEFSHASPVGWISLVLGAAAMGGSYVAWSHGITHGNITLLGIASYFTPVLSCLFASVWIHARLGLSFWAGVAVIVAGSLLCWSSTILRR